MSKDTLSPVSHEHTDLLGHWLYCSYIYLNHSRLVPPLAASDGEASLRLQSNKLNSEHSPLLQKHVWEGVGRVTPVYLLAADIRASYAG